MGIGVFFFSMFGYHGPLFMVVEYGKEYEKRSKLLMMLSILEISVFFSGIILRIICLLKVHRTLDIDKHEIEGY